MPVQLYHKPVCDLMHEMVHDMGVKPEDVLERSQVRQWFQAKYPLVKQATLNAHLTRMSINDPTRLNYSPRSGGKDDLFVKIDSGRFRLYQPDRDPAPITSASTDQLAPPGDESAPPADPAGSQFAYEHDLRDFLARNLQLIEPGLQLFEDDEGATGIEFNAGGRFVDVLAVDREGGYVVIELKVSKGYDRTVGQLLRYMGWIERYHAEPGQRVRGVIVAKDISEDLRLACARVKDVQLFEYELSVKLTAVAA
ncbi:MAG TPA: endonuclease NucS domain-containing protein [Longimicrobium sp.]|nr:endonuclease NucS domain-containing protein [Longimicrobium sp.]